MNNKVHQNVRHLNQNDFLRLWPSQISDLIQANNEVVLFNMTTPNRAYVTAVLCQLNTTKGTGIALDWDQLGMLDPTFLDQLWRVRKGLQKIAVFETFDKLEPLAALARPNLESVLSLVEFFQLHHNEDVVVEFQHR